MPHEPNDLNERLDRIEERLDALRGDLQRTNKGGGGVGCVGFALLVFILLQLGELKDIVDRIQEAVLP